MCLGRFFFEFIFSGIHSAFQICSLIPFVKLGKFSPNYFFESFFRPALFLLFFQNLDETNMTSFFSVLWMLEIDLLIVLQVLEIDFKYVFFFIAQIKISFVLIFRVTDLSPVIFILLLHLPNDF